MPLTLWPHFSLISPLHITCCSLYQYCVPSLMCSTQLIEMWIKTLISYVNQEEMDSEKLILCEWNNGGHHPIPMQCTWKADTVLAQQVKEEYKNYFNKSSMLGTENSIMWTWNYTSITLIKFDCNIVLSALRNHSRHVYLNILYILYIKNLDAKSKN
jgi:hypothetical protein